VARTCRIVVVDVDIGTSFPALVAGERFNATAAAGEDEADMRSS
jgi:hypothetical protein